MSISRATLYAYRGGKQTPSDKALRKLREAELKNLATTAPAKAIAAVEAGLSLKHYGERPLDEWIKPTEDNPEKIATALLHAAGLAHVWLADTEALTNEYIERLEQLASGQRLEGAERDEFPNLTKTVQRRRAKLSFMRQSVVGAVEKLLGSESSPQ